MNLSVLIVEDEKNTREGLLMALEESYDVYAARDGAEAIRMMDEQDFDVILTDLKMSGKDGMRVIDAAITSRNRPICIMMTAYGSVETAVEAMKRGAHDFLTKPVNLERLELIIKRALDNRSLVAENQQLHARLDEKFSFNHGIVGRSGVLNRVIEEVRTVAPSKASVLLYGETGTGKELFAELLHQNSPRSKKPFVVVHCAALPANLLESELFGHEKGAFTGASEKRLGRFEVADGGTLFLDEIGEIDASMQVKLLRFLETKSFQRIGSNKTIQVDVRLVCATNKNLAELVAKNQFREDLFYRLNVITIQLPALRNRASDIPALSSYYLNWFAKENGLKEPKLSAEVVPALMEYDWPGNVRELKNFCERLVVFFHGKTVLASDLDSKYFGKQKKELSLDKESNEKKLIKAALDAHVGNRSLAAKELGISRRTLYRKIEKWPELEQK